MSIELTPPRSPGRRGSLLLAWLISALSVIVLLLWIPITEVWTALQAVGWRWLALAAALTVINLIVRGLRWAWILGLSGSREFGLSVCLCSLAVGINAVVPGKAGELVRIGLAARRLRLRIGRVVAAALAERLLDLLVLLVLVALPLSYLAAQTGAAESESIAGLHRAARKLAWACAAGSAGLLLLGHGGLNKRMRGLAYALTRRRFPGAARGLHRFLNELRRALIYVAAPYRLITLLALTLVMWLALGLGVYIAALGSAQVHLSLPLAVAFGAVTVLAAALPSAPGAWGVFEAAGVVFLIALTGATDRAAVLAFVLAVHLIQYLPVVLGAGLSWLLLGRDKRIELRG